MVDAEETKPEGGDPPEGGATPSEEELRAQLEEEIRRTYAPLPSAAAPADSNRA